MVGCHGGLDPAHAGARSRVNPLAALRRGLVRVLAALGARPPPRRAGIDDFIPAMFALAPVLALPVFTLLLWIVRTATADQPGRREPLLPLAIDSLVVGAFIATGLVSRWRAAIDAQLAEFDRLPPPARLAWRLWPILLLGVVATLMAAAVVAYARR